MRTTNPALNESAFRRAEPVAGSTATMTLNGAVAKTGILTLLLVASAAYSWNLLASNAGQPSWFGPALRFGWIIPLVLALVISFKPATAPWLSPVYAVLKGFLVGILSAAFNATYPGIVIQAVMLTAGVLFALLGAYSSGLIKATENFKLGVFAATMGIAIVYLITWALSLFGVAVPFIHDNGWLGIGISAFVVVIAALNLVLDFDFIEQGAAMGAPKYMEWYAGFGLLVTLVWLYIEILRLLGKLNSRN